MSQLLNLLPVGTKKLFKALRDAGVENAAKRRNVPWVTVASDGVIVVNVWRDHIRRRGRSLVANVDSGSWHVETSARKRKLEALVAALASENGGKVRLVVLEDRAPEARSVKAARCDEALWFVQQTGKAKFRLLRGSGDVQGGGRIPPTPSALGKMSPGRREITSQRIERDPRVRAFTLNRARNHCETDGCTDSRDFSNPDVHHITALGDGGSDHTDNTVALCPACHARLHRGTGPVRKRMERSVLAIRRKRMHAVP